MQRSQRMRQILERLVSEGEVNVDQLASGFAVSEATIRRDLAVLDEQRLLQRTRGGARTHSALNDVPLRFKVVHRFEEKRRIARRAYELMDEARVIGMSGGTTTTTFAELLVERDDLTIVTNALNIAMNALSTRGPRVFVAGGEARNGSYETVGPAADEQLRRYNLDITFFGVDGIHGQAGCTIYDPAASRTNLALITQAARVVVLADSDKVGRVALTSACPIDAVDVLITDSDASPKALREIEAAGVEIIVV
jgi:DeoR family transcriptional regulator, aga operon transcriptional repressor